MSFISDLRDDTMNIQKLEEIIENIITIYDYSREQFLDRIHISLNSTAQIWFDKFETYLKFSKLPIGIFIDQDLFMIFLDSTKFTDLDEAELDQLLENPSLIEIPSNHNRIDINHFCAGLMYTLVMLLLTTYDPKQPIIQEIIYNKDLTLKIGQLLEKTFGQNRPSFLIVSTISSDGYIDEININ